MIKEEAHSPNAV